MRDTDEGAAGAAIAPPAKPKDYIFSTLFIVLAGIVLPVITLGGGRGGGRRRLGI